MCQAFEPATQNTRFVLDLFFFLFWFSFSFHTLFGDLFFNFYISTKIKGSEREGKVVIFFNLIYIRFTYGGGGVQFGNLSDVYN